MAQWTDRGIELTGGSNAEAGAAELVVMATPWESATATAVSLVEALSDKVVVSMANALVKQGSEVHPLIPPRGSIAGALQAALPRSPVVAAFHHLPARRLADLDADLQADVLVCSDHPDAMKTVSRLIDDIDGLRPLDVGSLAQATAIEAFTAVCVNLNMRYRVHSTVTMSGI